MPRTTINSNDIRDKDIETIDIKPSSIPDQIMTTNSNADGVEWKDSQDVLGNIEEVKRYAFMLMGGRI